MNTKICSQCKQELPITDFYSRGGGRYRSECKTCHKKYVSAQYLKKKDVVEDYKAQCKCAKCGESRGHCLDFHHIDSEQKEANIARLVSNRSNLNSIIEEIKKCIVLCANCHRDFHFQNKLTGISIDEYIK